MQSVRDTVLVTGAGGFIGGRIVRQLAGDPVYGVVRATRDGRDGSRRLDVLDSATLPTALAGITAVVHCAVGNRAVTVDGTAALLAAAARAGVRRFVHLSSVAVYGAATGPVTEASPTVPATGRGYPAWKAAAEQGCLAQAGLEVVRLRPAIVYGPGSSLWVDQLARRIRSGRWGLFGLSGEGTCNLVHVDDVAAAALAALRAERAPGAAFNISGTEVMTWNRWFSSIAGAIGAPDLQPISPAAVRARVALSLPLKAMAKAVPGLASDWLLGAPARSELALYALRATYPVDAAKAVLGWEPRISPADGLAEIAAGLRDGPGAVVH